MAWGGSRVRFAFVLTISSPAIGSKIESLHYDADSGYLVIELDSGEELWISADWEGYRLFCSSQNGGIQSQALSHPPS